MRCKYALLGLLSFVILGCLFTGCSARVSDPELATEQSRQLFDGMPPVLPFPADTEAPARLASAEDVQTKLGKETYQRSAGAEVNGDSLDVSAAAGELAYGLYQFTGLADADQPLELAIERTDLQPAGYYLGIADYSAGSWLWSTEGSPSASTVTDTVPFPSGVKGISPAGNLFVVILAWDDTTLTVESVSLTSDINGEAPVAAFTAAPSHGNAPLSVSFDASTSSVRGGGSISSYAWDFDGDGSVDETNADPTASHEYADPGEYQAHVVVTETDSGLTDEHAQSVYAHDWIHTWGGADMESIVSMTSFAGHLYVLGQVTDGSDSSDFLLAEFDRWGMPVWQRRYGADGDDVPGDIAYISDEGIIVAGTTDGFELSRKSILIACFSETGEIRWQKVWSLPLGDVNSPPKIALDGDHNIHVAFCDSKGYLEVLKVTPQGDVYDSCWRLSPTDRFYSCDICYAISGSLCLATAFWDTVYDGDAGDLAVIKLDLTGTITDQTLLKPAPEHQIPAIQADRQGNYYIASSTGSSELTMKLNSALEVQWCRKWDFPGAKCSGTDIRLGYDLLSVDSILASVMLSHIGSPYNQNAALLSFNPAGTQMWSYVWPDSEEDIRINSLAWGIGGAILLGGSAPNNDLTRLDTGSSTQTYTLNPSALNAERTFVTGVSFTPDCTVSAATGVIDTGGGGDDFLLMGIDPDDL